MGELYHVKGKFLSNIILVDILSRLALNLCTKYAILTRRMVAEKQLCILHSQIDHIALLFMLFYISTLWEHKPIELGSFCSAFC